MNKIKDDWAERIRHGDKAAESELFSYYGVRIATTVKIRLGINNPDWEDVCSEIKTAILIKLREGVVDPKKGNLSSYFHGVALNKIKDYYKSEKKKKKHLQTPYSEEIPDPVDQKSELEMEELKRLIRKVINNLNEKYKDVIYLRYYQGLSIQEIATQLQIESRRVSERINYANKLIRKQCKKMDLFSIF